MQKNKKINYFPYRDLLKTGVNLVVSVGEMLTFELETPEIPRRRATAKKADAYP